jgi:hypothetical protein
MRETVSVQLIKRGTYRSVNIRECERLPIQANHAAILGLGVLTRWIAEHYGVGQGGPDVGPALPDTAHAMPVEWQEPQPHALFRDPADGIVLVEVWGSRWLPSAARYARHYQVEPAILRRYLKGSGFDAITITRWSGKVTSGRTGSPRDGHKTSQCLEMIRQAFRDYLEFGTGGWPKPGQLAKHFEHSKRPAWDAWRKFQRDPEFQAWKLENPRNKWGVQPRTKR